MTRTRRLPSFSIGPRCSSGDSILQAAVRQVQNRRYEELLNQESANKIEQVEIYIPPGSADIVVEARGLRKAYGDLLLIADLDFTLPPGGIVGVIGPNGLVFNWQAELQRLMRQ